MTDWKERAERAEAELARLRAQEPEYWQWRRKHDPWEIGKTFNSQVYATTADSEVRCLYAAPPAQPAEPVQRLSDAGIEALAGKHGTTYRNRHFPTQPAFSFSNGSLHRFVRDIESALQPGWRDIESAPRDGSKILLAKYGWSNDAGDAVQGSDEWKRRILDQTRRKYGLWWCVAGHWSARWNNWNDGVEPSGLAGPTHWMPLPPAPKATK